ncbi:hypothetical protein SLEP1_g40428 [Rubroshorea leprosula]|uniref:Uncharacterized protein n=1 Tax=Rubroshorea leprosula TaxID=152421 RepID=A0AAV5L3U4_9ROSI|nr:hypothetical protein SLEP1_g40428 [Rubroshorea leprosula]
MANEEDNNMDDWSIPRLISLLKKTFRAKDFGMVEDVLTARERKSRSEINKLEQEKESLKDSYYSERFDKVSMKKELSEELTRCKMERKEFGDQVARLREEKKILCEEVGQKDKEIIDLRRRICEMECSKTKAEAENEIWRKRHEELDARVLRLEDEMTLLTNSSTVERGGVCEAEDNQGNAEKTKEKVIDSNKKEDDEAVDGPSCGAMIQDNGRLQSEGCGRVCEVKENQENVKKTEKVIDADKSKDAELGVGLSCDKMMKDNGHLQIEGTGKHSATYIVEITDSDDDCAPSGIQNGKEMTLKCPVEGAHLGQMVVENKMLKRKRPSGLNMNDYEDNKDEENIDDNAHSGKGKMKLEETTYKPDISHSSLNCGPMKAISARSNDVEKVFTPSTSRQGLEVTRQCEEKMESEDRSQSHDIISGFTLGSLGFETESSESSESDTSDVDMDFLLSLHKSSK